LVEVDWNQAEVEFGLSKEGRRNDAEDVLLRMHDLGRTEDHLFSEQYLTHNHGFKQENTSGKE
jgi:hypothetical protein